MSHKSPPIVGSIPFYYQYNTLNEFNSFVDRLDYIFEVNRIGDEEIKKVILLTYIDGESYHKIKVACGASGPPKDKTYDELIQLLRANRSSYTYGDPNRNVYAERRRFYGHRMDDLSRVEDFARDIEYYADPCRFKEGRDEILRDAFITGLKKELQAVFYELEPTGMTFKEAAKIAINAEASMNIRNGTDQIKRDDGTVIFSDE